MIFSDYLLSISLHAHCSLFSPSISCEYFCICFGQYWKVLRAVSNCVGLFAIYRYICSDSLVATALSPVFTHTQTHTLTQFPLRYTDLMIFSEFAFPIDMKLEICLHGLLAQFPQVRKTDGTLGMRMSGEHTFAMHTAAVQLIRVMSMRWMRCRNGLPSIRCTGHRNAGRRMWDVLILETNRSANGRHHIFWLFTSSLYTAMACSSGQWVN